MPYLLKHKFSDGRRQFRNQELLENVAFNVEFLRKRNKFRKNQLAALLLIQPSSYQCYIDTDYQFTVSQLAQLCMIFQVNAHNLLFKKLKSKE